jgi:hypothetical protein
MFGKELLYLPTDYKVIAHVDNVGLTELDEGCLPIPEIL